MENKKERQLILILSCVQFAHILDFVLVMPLGPQLIHAFDLNASQLGWLVSSYTFAAAISGMLVSQFMDRVNRKKALTVFCLILSFSTLACAFAPTFGLLLFARSLAGASGGVLNGILLAIIGDQIPEDRRGAAIGKVMSSFAIASVVGIPANLYLASLWGWSSPFLVLGAIAFAIVSSVHKWLLLPEFVKTKIVKLDNHRLSKKYLFLGLASTFFLMFAGFSVVPYVSTSLVANAGVKESSLFIIYLVAGTTSFFLSRFIGILSDRYGKLKTFYIIGSCSIFSTLIITRLDSVGILLSAIATAIYMAFNSSRTVPLLSLLVSKVPVQSRGRFMSLNSSAQQFAAGMGAAFSSYFVNIDSFGRLTGFENVGIVSIVAILCSLASAKIFNAEPH